VARAKVGMVLLGALAWTIPWTLACAGLPLAGVPAPDATVQAVIEEWPIEDGRFAGDVVDCPVHGAGLAWLATHEDPERARAGLLALGGCPADTVPHRADALVAALGREDPGVVGAALAVAREGLAEAPPDDPVLDAVATVMLDHRDKGVRYEAVEALDAYPWAADPAMAERMLGALSDVAPPVVSEVLSRAHARSAGLAEPLPWLATARFAMLAHLDPGIRGRAALLAARLAPLDAGVRRQLRELLEDKHPYTRSAAAKALADCGDVAAVHLLMGMVRDDEVNTWTMLPWTGTDDVLREQVHKGSHLGRVNDAVFRAIEELTSPMDDGYSYRSVSLKYIDLDLISARRDAEKWYESHRDQLPAVEDGAETD